MGRLCRRLTTSCGVRKKANGMTRSGEGCGRTKRRVRVAISRGAACRRKKMKGGRATRIGKVRERMRKRGRRAPRRAKMSRRRAKGRKGGQGRVGAGGWLAEIGESMSDLEKDKNEVRPSKADSRRRR
jgi:hypothetical protein